MKFEEFRSLIEERKELYSNIAKYYYNPNFKNRLYRIIEIDRILYPNEMFEKFDFETLIKRESKIENLFEAEGNYVIDILKKFFNKNNIKYSIGYNYSIGVLDIIIITKKDKYCLILNGTLNCLCCNNVSFSWEKLMRDYPNLKDYLWKEFKELKNAEKRKEMTLIQKRLAKNNEEIDLLISPSKREARISELLDNGTKMQKQIEEISESLEEIDIV